MIISLDITTSSLIYKEVEEVFSSLTYIARVRACTHTHTHIHTLLEALCAEAECLPLPHISGGPTTMSDAKPALNICPRSILCSLCFSI